MLYARTPKTGANPPPPHTALKELPGWSVAPWNGGRGLSEASLSLSVPRPERPEGGFSSKRPRPRPALDEALLPARSETLFLLADLKHEMDSAYLRRLRVIRF